MVWVILGVLIVAFLGLEAWVLCKASANREAAWARAAGKDQVVG